MKVLVDFQLMRGFSLRDVLVLHVHALVVLQDDFFFLARSARVGFVVETSQRLKVDSLIIELLCRFRLILFVIGVDLTSMVLCLEIRKFNKSN